MLCLIRRCYVDLELQAEHIIGLCGPAAAAAD